MRKVEKYVEALKSFDDWAIVSQWAVRVGELYPDVLEEANKQAKIKPMIPQDYVNSQLVLVHDFQQVIFMKWK